ncbi:MAG TPA: hypothetical protein VE783_01075 [Candidatus Limnocylindrales bacterium]|nr:hypothetical protein [Candidatus Limnocylindrales bacterium]
MCRANRIYLYIGQIYIEKETAAFMNRFARKRKLIKVDRLLALVTVLWLITSVALLLDWKDSRAQAAHSQPHQVESARLHHAAARALQM